MKKLFVSKGITFLLCLFSLSLFMDSFGILKFQNQVQASDEDANHIYRIDYEESDLIFPYQTYKEAEIQLNGGTALEDTNIQWRTIDGEIPPGLQLEDSTTRVIKLFGLGNFVDRWCFVIAAMKDNTVLTSREVCLNGTDNKTVDYPKLKRSSILPPVEVNKKYRERLTYKASKEYTYTGTAITTLLPKGIKVTFETKRNRFVVSGTPKETGVFRFVVKLVDNFKREVSKQYQFEVIPHTEPPPQQPDPLPEPPIDPGPYPDPGPGPAPEPPVNPYPNPIYQCPPGYYYNPTFGYCVEDRQTVCPPGTYYDSYRDSCEPYRREESCGPDYYYDYFLDRCVYNGYPRCPWNYEYSNYYGRCVRQPYTCSYGYKYDWYLKECVRSRHSRSCSYDSYWDFILDRCEPNWNGCRAGYRWDYVSHRCERRRDDCRRGEYYDHHRGGCTRRDENCGPGSRYNYDTNRCEYYDIERRCHQGEHWDHQSRSCVNDNPNQPPRPRPNCQETPQTPVACLQYAGQYGIPANAKKGNATWTKNSCTGEIKYTGGCSVPANNRCEDIPQTPVACSQYAGQYGIPANAKVGNASWTKNSCTDQIKYTGGCSVEQPRCEDVAQTPVACSQYAGQYGIPANATKGNASWTRNTCSGAIKYTGGCTVPDQPRCEDVPQTPVACSQYAGQYGIPANATEGNASWTKNSCTGAIKYTGGCRVPSQPPRCEDVPQTPVKCSDYAGKYGIPADATEGNASWTKNSCTGDIKYTGGCRVPSRPRCEDVPQSPVRCSDYAGKYGIPADATEGNASWTKNSCTGDIKYTGGCRVPSRPRCEDVPQTPVRCADYAGQYGIPSNATEGNASWTKNSCTGNIKYTGGCRVPSRPSCEDVPQSPVRCSDYAGQYGIPSNATEGNASWTKNSCTGNIRYTGGCRVPSRPRCEDVPQSPVRCSDYAGQYGIPSDATEGSASWTKNSCTGNIRYTGGCRVPSRPRCEDVPQTPVRCADYAGQYGIPAGATHGSASWTKNSCTGEIRYTGGCY